MCGVYVRLCVVAACAFVCVRVCADVLASAAAQAEKQTKLAEIRGQLQDTNSSVKQGKQLLGSLAETYGNSAPPPTYSSQSPFPAQHPSSPDSASPHRILTTSPILSDRTAR